MGRRKNPNSKEVLLNRANKCFQGVHNSSWFSVQNKGINSLGINSLPEITSIIFSHIEVRPDPAEMAEVYAESRFEGRICLKTRKGTSFALHFACVSSGLKSTCFLAYNPGRNIKKYAEKFLEFFIYDFSAMENFSLEQWNRL